MDAIALYWRICLSKCSTEIVKKSGKHSVDKNFMVESEVFILQ